jgi:hypothetical protein
MKFGTLFRIYFLLIPLLLWVVAPLFLPASWFLISEGELLNNSQLVGEGRHEQILQASHAKFNAYFVDNGIVKKTLDMTKKRGDSNATMAKTILSKYVNNFWLQTYKVLYRIELVKFWYVGFLTVLIAAFVDGMVIRKKKTYAADIANPLAFHIFGHAFFAVIGGLVLLPLLPFTISNLAWPIATAVFCLLTWAVAKNFQTGR